MTLRWILLSSLALLAASISSDELVDLHRRLLSPEEMESLKGHLRGLTMYGGGGCYGGNCGGGGYHDGQQHSGMGGQQPGMGGGGGSQQGLMLHAKIDVLFDNVDTITRTQNVMLQDGERIGLEATTTSTDPMVAQALKDHVDTMTTAIANGARPNMMDPFFAELYEKEDDMELVYEKIADGVHVKHAGWTRCGAEIAIAHGTVLNAFISNGWPEHLVPHAVPDVCFTNDGDKLTTFDGFADGSFNANATEATSYATVGYGNGSAASNSGLARVVGVMVVAAWLVV